MDEFQMLVLSALSFLTISMFIFFYLMVIKSKQELGTMKQELQAQLEKDSPSNCLHYLGFLKAHPRNKPIPDECLGCPKVMSCLEAEKHKYQAR